MVYSLPIEEEVVVEMVIAGEIVAIMAMDGAIMVNIAFEILNFIFLNSFSGNSGNSGNNGNNGNNGKVGNYYLLIIN